MNELTIREQGTLQAQALTEDMFSRYVAFIDAKPKTVETYTRAVRQLLTFLQARGITQPTREDIIAFREELKATGHKPTTVQNYITAARGFFQWLEQEHIYPNVAAHIKGAKLNKEHKKDYLNSRQVKAILGKIDRDSLQGLRDYAIMVLMITGGLRTVEVSRANVEDLRTLGDNTVLYVLGKGRDEKAEYIKIDGKVEEAIRDYLKARGSATPSAPLFASMSNNSMGGRLSTRTVSGIAKSRLKAAGYDSDKLTAHSLRHTAVTLSLLAGKNITEVQQFARHSNIATTMIYNHALDKAKNGCSEAIAKAIF
jgi:integrase/recombinase XerC